MVSRGAGGILDALRAEHGVQAEVDYGAFVLLEVDRDEATPIVLRDGAEVRERDDFDRVWLNGYPLETRRPNELRQSLPSALVFPREREGTTPEDAGLYLVQFLGPPRDTWLTRLAALGARAVQYLPSNAYLVSASSPTVRALEAWRHEDRELRFLDVYEPAYRLSPGLRRALLQEAPALVPVTVQLLDDLGVERLVDSLREAAAAFEGDVRVGPYRNVLVSIDSRLLRPLAVHPLVVTIEERGYPLAQDERQGLIVAGSTSGPNVVGPGYVAWLNAHGFDDTQFGSFAVNVVDSFISLAGHPDLPSSRILFQENPTMQTGLDSGHGFFDAQIVAGFNDQAGSAFEDVDGFNYGMGVAPWSLIGGTAIFGPGARVATVYEQIAYAFGARISTNSYILRTSSGQPIRTYDTNAQEADALVRDSQGQASGNQEYTMTFAAGNAGPTMGTIGTPGTAKNVITVGASENDRPFGTDGCNLGPSGADDVRDLSPSTSNGPVNQAEGDGRWKPDIVAPGTHIQAGVPQSALYTGAGLCSLYYPPAQTLYTWSSGTSHATPAVAGGAALVYQHFLNQGFAPSPALTKAVLLNAAEYMTGTGANDTLPSNAQGMGRMNLGRTFDDASRVLVDQSVLFMDSGESYVLSGDVVDPALPFRVTLAWTDAPGPANGSPWVNDLDLTVDAGGARYLGNVFSSADSVSGGSPDFKNNVESVFLPAGVSGTFTVTITAVTIAGDGVPHNGEGTDQDFALVIYNGAEFLPPVASFSGSSLRGGAPLTASFEDTSSGSITGWDWDFGDGTASTEQNPTHVYGKPGKYAVSLTASGPLGNDTVVRTDLVRVFWTQTEPLQHR